MKNISLSIIFISIWIANLYSQDCRNREIFNIVMPSCNTQDYQLLFEDNFDGNTIDANLWNVRTGVIRDYPLFINEKHWLMAENVIVSDGTLKIVGKKFDVPYIGTYTNYSNNPWTNETSTFQYSTGEIWTKQQMFNQGKYEIRCRMPKGQGLWPAFWLFEGSPETMEEIDFFEIYGGDFDEFTCNIYHGKDEDGTRFSCRFKKKVDYDFSEWHTFTCTWDSEKITFLVDNVKIREYFKYTYKNLSLLGVPIDCDDNITPGKYFENLVWPTKNMQLILNLAIQSGNKQPNSSTVFPAVFEVDYVRVYAKPNAGCVDCLSEMNFQQTNNLPELNMSQNLITASNNVVVQENNTVSFHSNLIKLNPGFSVEKGANFLANVQSCNEFIAHSNPIKYSNNLYNQYQLLKCLNPSFSINLTGVMYYEIKVYQIYDNMKLVCESSGEPISNLIEVCNSNNLQTGPHRVRLKMSNCLGTDSREFNIDVLTGECKSTENEDNHFFEDSKTDEIIYIYPNPSTNVINIVLNSKFKISENEITIFDTNGKLVHSLNLNYNFVESATQIDVSAWKNGIYFLRLEEGDNIEIKKFAIIK